MKVRTQNLQDGTLDFTVAKLQQPGWEDWRLMRWIEQQFFPTTDWERGGPIIESSRICLDIDSSGVWIAFSRQNYEDDKEFIVSGSSALEAAMRCYVRKHLGDEVELPEEFFP